LIVYPNDDHISVSEPWIKCLHEEDEAEQVALRRSALREPELYLQLLDDFMDKQLPPMDKLARTLHVNAKYGILKDAAETAARVFVESASFAGMLDPNNFLKADSARVSGGAPQRSADADSRTAMETPSVSRLSVEAAQIRGAGQTVALSSHEVSPAASGADLDRLEVQLANGRRAYLHVPVPLSAKEKERLKKFIDLIIEPDEYESPLSAHDQGRLGA
jgi:hypothetical protein